MNKKLLNTIAQRLVDLNSESRLTFPPLSRDFPQTEIEAVMESLLGETSSSVKIRELEQQVRDGEEQLDGARTQVEDLEREVSDLEDELSKERNR